MNGYEQADHAAPPSGHLSDAEGSYLKMFDCAYPRSVPQVAMRETMLFADGITNGAIRRVQEDPAKEAAALAVNAIAGAAVSYALLRGWVGAPTVIGFGAGLGARYLQETLTHERIRNIYKATRETAMSDDPVALRRNMLLMEKELGQPALDFFNTCVSGGGSAVLMKQMLRAPLVGTEAVDLMPYRPFGQLAHSRNGEIKNIWVDPSKLDDWLAEAAKMSQPIPPIPAPPEPPLPAEPPVEFERRDIRQGDCPGRYH